MFTPHCESSSPLAEHFYRLYDDSRFLSLLRSELHSRFRLIGKGFHSEAFLIPCQNGDSLVLSVQKAESDYDQIRLRLWRKNLQFLSTIRAPLIPPFAVLVHEDRVGLVLPYGQPGNTTTQAEIRSLRETLKKNGLVLKDSEQIAVCQKVPFIYDWSDLEKLWTVCVL